MKIETLPCGWKVVKIECSGIEKLFVIVTIGDAQKVYKSAWGQLSTVKKSLDDSIEKTQQVMHEVFP